MEGVWECDDGNGLPFEEYERQQKKDMVTIDAFVQPTKISIRGPASKQQQEPLKRVPFEKHYMTIYNQYVNEKFGHLHDDEEDHDGQECSHHSFTSEESDNDDSTVEGRKRRRSEAGGDFLGLGTGREKRKKFDISQPYECFLCGWGNVQHDSIEAPHINKMVDIIELNKGIHSPWDIAIQVSTYFMKDVYDPESGMDVLTPEIVYDHIINCHSLDAASHIAERIRKRKQYIFIMEQNVVLEDGSVDIKMMEQIDKCDKILLELYGKKPSLMMFSNGNNAEDMKRQANCISLLPKMEKVSTRKAKRRVIL